MTPLPGQASSTVPIYTAPVQQEVIKPVDTIQEMSTSTVVSLIKKYSDIYKVDSEKAKKIAYCESSYIAHAHNPNDPNDGSFGVYQFQRKTFSTFASDMGEQLNINNPEDNIKVAIYAFSKNKYSHWSCARKLGYVN
jgi:soluble lytic murein transglycosylase-like protein